MIILIIYILIDLNKISGYILYMYENKYYNGFYIASKSKILE